MRNKIVTSVLGGITLALIAATSFDAKSDVVPYSAIPQDQAEFISTSAHIVSVAVSGAPMAIWETLEHGEKVECIDCVNAVAPLIYDQNARTREISVWWMRRRMFGVFGPGEVYSQTLKTLAGDADPQRRAFAAYAIGEFLEGTGVAALATALKDADPRVRGAAASGLARLDDDGAGALSLTFTDADESVRLAGIAGAGRINSFTDAAGVSRLVGDSSAFVRRRAIMLLDQMQTKDAVASVLALAQKDGDAEVRLVACHALGSFGDPSAKGILASIAQNDANLQVRDQAQIALRRL